VKRKRVYDQKYRDWQKNNQLSWKKKGYCKINMWCPVEARSIVEGAITFFRYCKCGLDSIGHKYSIDMKSIDFASDAMRLAFVRSKKTEEECFNEGE
jgi:hypothetical protein